LHMTCLFVNLAPQLFASLHLCLPAPRTLQAPAGLSATSAACRAPPLCLSLIAPTHLPPPCAALCCPSGPSYSLPLAAAAAGVFFSISWESRKQAGAQWRWSRARRVNNLRALPRRLPGAREVFHLPPPFAWQFCIASHGSRNKKKKKCSNSLDVGIN
jgi:hypothetical protein